MATAAAVQTESGQVESKSRKGNSIKVNGEWYSVFDAKDLNHIEWKDEVVFNYAMKGDYRNIKGKVRKSSSGASPKAPSKGYSDNLVGIELGHASKLAMDMALKTEHDVGSPDFYKFWMEHTENVHKMMKSLKDKALNPTKAVPEDDDQDVVVFEKPAAIDEDIFE